MPGTRCTPLAAAPLLLGSGQRRVVQEDHVFREPIHVYPQAAPEPIAPVFPKAGMLAPKGDKAFVRGVTAYTQGNHEQAFAALEEARALDPDSRHVGEELFAGMSLVGLQRVSEAVPYFESVLASDHTIPDPIMARYNVGGSIQISVTPLVMVDVPMSNVAVALIPDVTSS